MDNLQEFRQREVKNGNKEKKQKGLKMYQKQNVFRKRETRMERDLTRVLWCRLRLSSVNTRSEMYVRFHLHVQVCILFGVCKRLCKECMCVLSTLDSWVEACEGKVGRSYYTRRVPEVSTFQRLGNRTHVEDIKSTSAASREKTHKKTLCQKLLKLIVVWLPYYQGPVATLCSHLLTNLWFH